jgi:hypothetical protein
MLCCRDRSQSSVSDLVSTGVHPRSGLVVFKGLEADFNGGLYTNVVHFDRKRIRYQQYRENGIFVKENAESYCLIVLNHLNWGSTGRYTVNYSGRFYNSIFNKKLKWAALDSNQRPPACRAHLPRESKRIDSTGK